MMKRTALFEQGTFVVTGEVGPVKGAVSRDKSIEMTGRFLPQVKPMV